MIKVSKLLIAGMTISVLLFAFPLSAKNYSGKRVFFVSSYHTGFPANDKSFAAIQAVFAGRGIVFQFLEMDTKRNPDNAFIKKVASRAKSEILAFKPDVVIINDDNAAKYLLEPYFKNSDIPFIFFGINWDASIYGLPYRNTTGMVEVVLVGELLKQLKKYAKGNRMGFLGGDRFSEHRNREFYEKRFHIEFEKTYFARSFTEWKAAFKKLQNEVDMVMLTSHAGITGWDDNKARKFVNQTIKVPVGTEHEWEMPFALVGVAKDFTEMGTWAARTALRVLDGDKPQQIPVTANKKGKLYFNPRIAIRLGISETPAMAELVD